MFLSLRVLACVHVHSRLYTCIRASVPSCVCASVRVFVRECVRACVRELVRAFETLCLRP